MSSFTNEIELRARLARRHHLAGWLGLLVFLTLGGFLETLHGFKIGYYLDADHKLRRELWRLAHAHGTLLAVVQLAFALGLPHFGRWTATRLKLASFFLLDAAWLMPLGFFLGGVMPSETDPSVGILLVPVGAVLLLIAVALILLSAGGASKEKGDSAP
jgi:hypothetical protein